jgi:hypothetical protein
MATPYSLQADLHRHARVWLVLVLGLLIWGWLDVRWRGVIEPDRPERHRTDLTAYTEAAAAFFDGRDPYVVTNIRGWGYFYPPLFALLMTPLIGLDSQTQVWLFYLASLLVTLGCYYELRRLATALADSMSDSGTAPHSTPLITLADWLALGLAVTLPALNTLQRGQVGLLKLYPLLLGTRLILFPRKRSDIFWGGVALAFPVALKITPLLPVALLLGGLVLRAVWKQADTAARKTAYASSLGIAVGSLAWWLVIPALVLGWETNLNYLASWHAKVIAKAEIVRAEDLGGDVTSPRNQSLANAGYRLGNWLAYRFRWGPDDRLVDTTDTAAGNMPMDAAWAERGLWLARLATLAWLGAAMLLLSRRGQPLDLVLLLSLGCVGTLVVSPISRGHYFVMLAPALLFIPAWLRTCGQSQVADLTPFLPATFSLAHYLGLEFTGRIGLLGVTTSLWLWAVLVRVVKEGSTPAAQPLTTVPQLKIPRQDPLRRAA